MTTHALVRTPAGTFACGLTASGLPCPDVTLARAQHDGYVAALAAAGVAIERLPADDRFPDGTFVEDAAIMTERGAILTRPGAPSRRGEVEGIRDALERLVPILGTIEAPGCLDGGDVCEAGSSVLIGLSDRTNEEGASQLASLLGLVGRRAHVVDVRSIPALLHLKTGMSYLGEGRALAWETLAEQELLRGFDVVRVPPEEAYAANAIRVNDRVFLAAGFPQTAEALAKAGFQVVTLEMSEFQKMDGGLSCLSLRW